MPDFFEIVGNDFFGPLTSKYKKIYLQCLRITYDSYRTELSYGIDREDLVQKLTYYFDELAVDSIQEEGKDEVLNDSREKSSYFLRNLKSSGWLEYEIGNDQRTMVIMPSHAVILLRSFDSIESGRETEYQSEIYAVYSLLTNPELVRDPYPMVVKPVYDRTVDLFTALKQLNTNIKKYIDELTVDKSAEEIIRNYFDFYAQIGSKAYHRLYTSDNVSRFRVMIKSKLDDIRNDRDLFEQVAWGYQRVENEPDLDAARDLTRKMLNDIVDYYDSYDDIVREIEKKYTRYLNNTVQRARFLLLNSNNMEGKISTILRYMAKWFTEEGSLDPEEDVPDELCSLFNIFPQQFISDESIKTVPESRRITDVDEIFAPLGLTEEERNAIRASLAEKNRSRFSKKNITAYVNDLLKETEMVRASDIEINSRRDMIRLIFISLYGQTSKTEYKVIPGKTRIEKHGFSYNDFEIRRKT